MARAHVILLWLALGCAPARAPDGAAASTRTPRAGRAVGRTTPAVTSGAPRASSTEVPGSLPAVGDVEATVDDEADVDDAPEPPSAGLQLGAHPLDGWSDARIEAALRESDDALGSISIGRPNAGALLGAVHMPDGEHIRLTDPANAWGTRETIDALVSCLSRVYERFPDAPPLYIGHVSARRGGHLRPHSSHQAGRDADVGYFYRDGARWYARAHEGNLDTARTWTFVKALIVESDVEMILIDHSVQRLLRREALQGGDDPRWVADVFDGTPGSTRPLIRHVAGHATHLHVRFYSPMARETARRAHAALAKLQRVAAPEFFIAHVAKEGETLGMLSKKYGVGIAELRRVNGLGSNRIIAGRPYRIPRQGPVVVANSERIRLPPRRLPPMH